MSFKTQFKKLFYYSLFRNSRAISIGIAIVVLLIGALWVLYPKYDSISKQGILSYDAKKLQLQSRVEYLNKLNSMLDNFRNIDSNKVAMANRILPGEKQIPELFVMLDQLGRDLGVRVSRIAFSSQTAVPATTKGGQAVSTTGVVGQKQSMGITVVLEFDDSISYGRYKEILTAFEQNIRIMDLNSVSYDSSQKSMSLNLTTYYLQTK